MYILFGCHDFRHDVVLFEWLDLPFFDQNMGLGKWFGDEQSVMVSITGAGPLDTSFTQTTSTSWMRLTFNSDGTGQVDSLGLDADLLTWTIQNNDLLVLDGMDTLMITKLNSTNLDLSMTEMDDSNAPILIEYDETIKFTK